CFMRNYHHPLIESLLQDQYLFSVYSSKKVFLLIPIYFTNNIIRRHVLSNMSIVANTQSFTSPRGKKSSG
ncbi:hypothetical protein L9F63_018344, partial [Diploptera punctata]